MNHVTSSTRLLVSLYNRNLEKKVKDDSPEKTPSRLKVGTGV